MQTGRKACYAFAVELREAFITLAISIGLGLLVGMQRERVRSLVAGFRTFGLITLLGTLCAMLAQTLGGWVVVAGLIGLAAATAVSNFIKLQIQREENEPLEPGITTEVAALVMFVVGAYLVFGHREVAVVVAGAVAVLLHAKPIMHRFVEHLGEKDMRAIMQFVLITLVILPVLPNEAYGPFGVLNPRQIWWMVVLVVGMSFGGYIAFKIVGQRAGAVLGGLLGGIVSSTATTVSYARRAAGRNHRNNLNRDADLTSLATLVIMLATTVVYVRVLVEVAVVARGAWREIAPPIGVMLGVSAALSIVAWVRVRRSTARLDEPENPTELKSALLFGVMYAAVVLAVAAAEHWFHDAGLYVVAGISGLTDMDAITLSTSNMVKAGSLSAATAWRAIVIASIANLVFKAGIVAALGGRTLFVRVATLFALNAAAGVALLVLWR